MHLKRNSKNLTIIAYSELFDFNDNSRLKDDDRIAILARWFTYKGVNVLPQYERQYPPPEESYTYCEPRPIPHLAIMAGDWIHLHSYDHCVVIRRLVEDPIVSVDKLTMTIHDVKQYRAVVNQHLRDEVEAIDTTEAGTPTEGGVLASDPSETDDNRAIEAMIEALITTSLQLSTGPSTEYWLFFYEEVSEGLSRAFSLSQDEQDRVRRLFKEEAALRHVAGLLHTLLTPVFQHPYVAQYYIKGNLLFVIHPQIEDEPTPPF